MLISTYLQAYLINITKSDALETAIQNALQPELERSEAIASYGKDITPWLDGQSAQRVMIAAIELIETDWEDRKPRNRWRNLKMRKTLAYWRL